MHTDIFANHIIVIYISEIPRIYLANLFAMASIGHRFNSCDVKLV